MSIQGRSKTVSYQYELATPEESFYKEEEPERDSMFSSWKRVNKRHHTTTTYLDPEPIDFNNKPIFESYNIKSESEEVAQNMFEVEPEEEGVHILEQEQTINTSIEEEIEKHTIQEKSILSTPPYSKPQFFSQANLAENTDPLAEVRFEDLQDEVKGSPNYVITKENTFEEGKISNDMIKEGFSTPRILLNEIPVVHRSLKDLINKTYKDFYNTDGNKIHIKAGLSKKSVSNLPSLHPTIRRKG